ncbi:MAG TPA: Ig-like domain-containing protein [Nocardioides sp.]|uniref:Ig-like domain-containing protein n=1 Tax=Nocardioides sp. TaxID=35761 RepID=UPI002BEF458B|nr:Ig-like domain-containing protein [Nocardioides sp.]HTW16782.1 Ig-like domain-containing protein [Nocardioides sp.]
MTDDLPPELTDVTASDTGTVTGGTVTWDLGTLAPDQSVTRTITGTGPSAGTLTNTVRGTTSTPDPDPGNNDGSAPAASVETTVVATVPTNNPPVAEPATYRTPVDQTVLERLEVSDPDTGQDLRTTLVSGPANGTAIVLPSGLFGYLPDEGFTGVDSFVYEVCDNGDPRLCDQATITVEVVPVAADDIVETVVNTPASVPELANDLGDDVTVSIVSGPSHGLASVQPDGSIRYTPGPGYLGTDVMHYRICATSAPTLCAEAEADVVVRPENRPPQLPDQVLRTVVDRPVDGTLPGTDPDGDRLTYTIVGQPAHGTASVSGAGTRYVPAPGFTGRDTYRVVVYDDGLPVFCSTGLVEVEVAPLAVDDRARTDAGRPVGIDVLANDAGAAGPPVVTSGPGHGRVVWRYGRYVYTPDDGFDGTDRFRYRICSPEPDPLCAEATVTIVVDPQDDDGDPAGGGEGAGGDDGGGDGSGDGQDDSAGGILPDTGGPALWLGLLGAGLLTGGGWLVRRSRRLPGSGPWSESGEAAAS